MYKLEYTLTALKQLRHMPPHLQKTVHIKMLRVAEDPYGKHNNAKKLQGRDGYRLRIGDWRVLYTIENTKITVWINEIKTRGSAYQ